MTRLDISAKELREVFGPTVRDQVAAELARLNPRDQPTSALVVTAFEDGLIEVGDDHVQVWCKADTLLNELKALPTGAPLGVQDPQPGSIWYAIGECEG